MGLTQLLDHSSKRTASAELVPHGLDGHLDDAALFLRAVFPSAGGLLHHQTDHGEPFREVFTGLVAGRIVCFDQAERIEAGLLIQIEFDESTAEKATAVHETLAVIDDDDLGVRAAIAGHQLLHRYGLAGTRLADDASVVVAGLVREIRPKEHLATAADQHQVRDIHAHELALQGRQFGNGRRRHPPGFPSLLQIVEEPSAQGEGQ